MQPLYREVFDIWRGDLDKKIDFLVESQRYQNSHNISIERRLSIIETHSTDRTETVNKRTTWMSAVVSAVVGGLVGLLTR